MGAAPAPAGAAARLGYWCFETMTPLVDGTYAAARAAVDVALTAADLVLDGAPGRLRAVPPARPPRAAGGLRRLLLLQQRGHRGRRTWPARPGTRVTVLDVDYHHGNGTQQIFYERDDVQYVSLHGDPNRAYPYFAGYADETRRRAGAWARRSTCRCPPGTDDATLPGRARPGRSTADRRVRSRPRWSSRSASTPSSWTPSPTSRSPPTASPAPAPSVAELGRPTSCSRRAATTSRRSARTSAPGWPPSTAPPRPDRPAAAGQVWRGSSTSAASARWSVQATALGRLDEGQDDELARAGGDEAPRPWRRAPSQPWGTSSAGSCEVGPAGGQRGQRRCRAGRPACRGRARRSARPRSPGRARPPPARSRPARRPRRRGVTKLGSQPSARRPTPPQLGRGDAAEPDVGRRLARLGLHPQAVVVEARRRRG